MSTAMSTSEKLQRVFKMFPNLQSQRFILRRPKMDDAQQLYLLARNETVSKYTHWNVHRSVSESLAVIEMIRRAYQDGKSVTWAVDAKATRELIGLIKITNIDSQNQSADLDYWLGQAYWGRGYMPEILRSVITFCCVGMGIVRIQGKHVIENKNAGQVMIKAGMTYEGTLRQSQYFKGRIWDVNVYSVLSEELFRSPHQDSSSKKDEVS
jgi:ribosomal-protein-alanine N-acetyltransferase